MKSDAGPRHDAVDELAHQRLFQATRVQVSIHGRATVLAGSVAAPACGVRAVESEAGLAAGPACSDADLEDAVARALAWDLWVPDQRLKVTVRAGLVTLEGEVVSRFQKEAAVRDVSRLPGVRGIVDRLAILPTPAPAEVGTRIARALGTDALPREIRVETFPGAVMLRGVVRSRAERDGAERAVWSVDGVREVWNRLDVKPETAGAAAPVTQAALADGPGSA